MKSFKEFLTEVFTTTYPFKKFDHDKGKIKETVYEFKTKKGQNVEVTFKKLDDERFWWVAFNVENSYGITGKGEAFEIFSTVISTIKDFIQSNSPIFKFTAEKSNDSDTRDSLYSKMVKTLANDIGYDFKITTDYDDETTTFELTKLPL